MCLKTHETQLDNIESHLNFSMLNKLPKDPLAFSVTDQQTILKD